MIVIPRPFSGRPSGMMLGKMLDEEGDVRSMQVARLTTG